MGARSPFVRRQSMCRSRERRAKNGRPVRWLAFRIGRLERSLNPLSSEPSEGGAHASSFSFGLLRFLPKAQGRSAAESRRHPTATSSPSHDLQKCLPPDSPADVMIPRRFEEAPMTLPGAESLELHIRVLLWRHRAAWRRPRLWPDKRPRAGLPHAPRAQPGPLSQSSLSRPRTKGGR